MTKPTIKQLIYKELLSGEKTATEIGNAIASHTCSHRVYKEMQKLIKSGLVNKNPCYTGNSLYKYSLVQGKDWFIPRVNASQAVVMVLNQHGKLNKISIAEKTGYALFYLDNVISKLVRDSKITKEYCDGQCFYSLLEVDSERESII